MVLTLKSTANGEFIAKNSNCHEQYINPNTISLSKLSYSFDLEITLWINLIPKIELKITILRFTAYSSLFTYTRTLEIKFSS